MLDECIRERLITGEAEFDVAAVERDHGGAEEIIPQAEADAVVDAVFPSCGKGLHMVPNVHPGIVQHILQRTVAEVQVAVVQVPDGCGENVDDEKILQPETDHGQGDVLRAFVEHVLHPVET